MLCCFAAICWNFGVIKILSTKDLVTVAFGVKSLCIQGQKVTSEFVGGRLSGGLLGSVWRHYFSTQCFGIFKSWFTFDANPFYIFLNHEQSSQLLRIFFDYMQL